ncbi:MAG: redoxin domain-containing protein [Bacteroidales bacterium]|nr:redoxin domain-containing protein [Bacteroidales bacterium]
MIRAFSMTLIGLFLVAGILSSCKKKEAEIPPDTTKTMAPAFSLVSLAGDTVSLDQLNGKVVVLFFLGYSCHYCIESAPEVQSMVANMYASNSNVVVLGLDVWDGGTAQVESFKTETGVTFPLLLNAGITGTAYGTTNDRLVVVDQMGYIRLTGQQAAYKDIDAVKGTVDMLLQ